MVASSSPQASLFGLRMLAAGGSAADAALAAAAGMQVTMPCQTGLGGDCFVLYYEAASGTVHALNGSGRSARGLSLELLRSQGLGTALPAGHAHNVTVPGAPAAWADLHARFGILPREQVVEPAAELATAGYPVAPISARLWQAAAGQLLAARHGAELLTQGRAPHAGEVMRIPTLAASLRTWGSARRGAVLPRADRRAGGGRRARGGRRAGRGRPGRAPQRLGAAAVRGLPRQEDLGVPSQRPGPGGAGRPADPRPVRAARRARAPTRARIATTC